MKFLKLNLFVLFLFLSALPMSYAVVSVQVTEPVEQEITKASFEEHLGRKLTFSEKIAFKIFNKKIKKAARSKKKQSKTSAVDCGKIVLKTGEILEVELIQISSTEVKYKRCNKPEDPEFVIDKKEIFSIQDAQGEILYTNKIPAEKMAADAKEKADKQERENKEDDKSYVDNQRTHGLAVASLVLGILSLLISFSVFGLICGVLAVVFGAIAKNKIKEDPDTFKGRKMAGAGLVLGIIACAFYALAAASIFSFI